MQKLVKYFDQTGEFFVAEFLDVFDPEEKDFSLGFLIQLGKEELEFIEENPAGSFGEVSLGSRKMHERKQNHKLTQSPIHLEGEELLDLPGDLEAGNTGNIGGEDEQQVVDYLLLGRVEQDEELKQLVEIGHYIN